VLKAIERRINGVTTENLAAEFPPAVEPAEVADGRLAAIAEELISAGLPAPLVQRLAEWIRTTPEGDLHRMRPRALAREWDAPIEEVLRVFLHATRAGMCLLTWDVLCPHCRGVRKDVRTLGDLPDHGSCEACDIDFDTTGLTSIEVTFRVHPSIRKVGEVFYCSAEPAKKPHIRLQRSLQATRDSNVRLDLEPRRYRLRVKGTKTYGLLDVREDAEPAVSWTAPGPPPSLAVAPAGVLSLVNHERDPVTFIVEEHSEDDDALRPVDLFNFQEFRDLFSEETLAADIKLDVGEQTILFTDVVASTRFYLEMGDPTAFAEIRSHFVTLFDIVRQHDGAIVKTIGDALMASFSRPSRAFQAAVAMQRHFTEDNAQSQVRLRITLHRGPCIAVKLDSNIDYFGSAVNHAAKMQSLVGAGELAFSEEFGRDPEVCDLLEKNHLKAEQLEFAILPDVPPQATFRLKVS
jgi:class 3 adenylate cyclase